MYRDKALNTFRNVLGQLGLRDGTWRAPEVLGRNLSTP